MVFLNWLRQLKKKLRLRRRNLALGLMILIICTVAAWLYWKEPGTWTSSDGTQKKEQTVFSHQQAYDEPNETEKQLAIIQQSKQQRNTFVKKSYVCGEELQSLGLMKPEDILQYHKDHPQQTVSLDETGNVYFTEDIEDLSPQCKNSAYFGLDENGNLSLFNGVPGKDNVIRTFFQLNISHLESSLPHDTVKQLYSGIRVTDLAEYNSVISTFSDFAVESSEKAATKPHMQ
jgi:forespore regulator of the sigma-K checkpoint